jgi:membrane-bound serine protease (ClpP class)
MTLILVLFGIGVALVAIEIVVPGGLLGILGGLSLVGGVTAAFVEYGGGGGALATGAALVILTITLYLEFVFLPKTRLARKFSMTDTVAGRSQPDVAVRGAVLDREAMAVTTLSPTGYVELDGRRYEAFSRSGYAVAGSRMRVVDMDNFRLVVTQIKESS